MIAKFFIFLFRVNQSLHRLRIISYSFGIIVNIIYRFIGYIIGVDIPWKTKIGKGFRISHPMGIVIHENTIIGENCWIRQNTTIGIDLRTKDAPIIGDNVNIGANTCIIGNVKIGDNSIIGAGSVVVKSIPENSFAVGNPCKVIKNRIVNNKSI